MAGAGHLREGLLEKLTVARKGIEADAIGDDAGHAASIGHIKDVLHQEHFVGRAKTHTTSLL